MIKCTEINVNDIEDLLLMIFIYISY